MTKGEATRTMVLERAATLFNQKGYFATSLSDIMSATGLEKGGIYNHFANKDALALAAFDFVVQRMRLAFAAVIRSNHNAVERIRSIVAIFTTIPQGFPVPGGCPVMNTAIESDNAHPALRDKARAVMREWQTFIRKVIATGVRSGELPGSLDPEHLASFLIAALEGAVMLSSLYDDPAHMDRTADHLRRYIDELALTARRS